MLGLTPLSQVKASLPWVLVKVVITQKGADAHSPLCAMGMVRPSQISGVREPGDASGQEQMEQSVCASGKLPLIFG